VLDFHLQLKFVISFLRGQLINHDTQPSLLVIRSNPNRPLHQFQWKLSFTPEISNSSVAGLAGAQTHRGKTKVWRLQLQPMGNQSLATSATSGDFSVRANREVVSRPWFSIGLGSEKVNHRLARNPHNRSGRRRRLAESAKKCAVFQPLRGGRLSLIGPDRSSLPILRKPGCPHCGVMGTIRRSSQTDSQLRISHGANSILRRLDHRY
jgi:hypothetical protein